MPIFLKSIAGSLFVIVLGVYLLNGSKKSKIDLFVIGGSISYLDKEYNDFPTRNKGKYRYLIVEGVERVFELFIGNDPGDFRPEFEKIDGLRAGDTITLYYDENSYTEGKLINRLTKFIDKGEEKIFVKGSKYDNILAYVVIGLGVILVVILIALKMTGKIY